MIFFIKIDNTEFNCNLNQNKIMITSKDVGQKACDNVVILLKVDGTERLSGTVYSGIIDRISRTAEEREKGIIRYVAKVEKAKF